MPKSMPPRQYKAAKISAFAHSHIREKRKSMDWVSARERLPSEDEDVYVLVRETELGGEDGAPSAVYYWQYTGFCLDGEWATSYCRGFEYLQDANRKNPGYVLEVTHWRPAEALPEELRPQRLADRL